MNLVPSDLPSPDGALRLPRPGFDIVLAVSTARQAASPTVRMLRDQMNRDSHRARLNALRAMMAGIAVDQAPHPVRFFDLSDDANALPETMNSLFTRGFQSMLNPLHIDRSSPGRPASPDVDIME